MTSPSMMTLLASTTSSTILPTATNSMSMDGHCKISMLWNWYTIDACFISSTWRVTSRAMFAGSCIGVVSLVVCLEFLRRAQREYESHIRRQIRYRGVQGEDEEGTGTDGETNRTAADNTKNVRAGDSEIPSVARGLLRPSSSRSVVQQQFVRAALHTLQFGVAYFVMLLAMYYNGYFIISILIGAFLGSFLFSWDQVKVDNRTEAADVTGCCG